MKRIWKNWITLDFWLHIIIEVNDFYNSVYISVSLDNEAENCELPAYPGSSRYPAAVNYMETIGEVVACGGETLAGSSKCFAFDGYSWTSLPDSTQHHCYFESHNLIVDQGWWVVGWLQSDNGVCVNKWSSEVFNGEEWFQGPPHPTGPGSITDGICLAHLNSTHSLYSGGDPTYTASWLYDWTEGVWTQTGDLNEGRYGHGCTVQEGQGVFVAGGYKDDFVYSVELYDPETGTWTLQPGLPQEIDPSDPTLLPWSESLIALFSGEDQVYQRADDGTWSALEGVVLPDTFDGYCITIVPQDFANGCM